MRILLSPDAKEWCEDEKHIADAKDVQMRPIAVSDQELHVTGSVHEPDAL